MLTVKPAGAAYWQSTSRTAAGHRERGGVPHRRRIRVRRHRHLKDGSAGVSRAVTHSKHDGIDTPVLALIALCEGPSTWPQDGTQRSQIFLQASFESGRLFLRPTTSRLRSSRMSALDPCVDAYIEKS